MYCSLSKWISPKAKIKAFLREIDLPEYLVISKTRKRRETPQAISVFKQNSSSSQPGHPQPVWKISLQQGMAQYPPQTHWKYHLTPNTILIQYLQKNTLICIPRTIEKLMEMTAIHTALCLQQWKGQTN